MEGISSYLKSAYSGALDPNRLYQLAEGVASGQLVEPSLAELSRLDASGAVVHAALTHGFGLVMLYGGICIWLLAAASFMIFFPRRQALQATSRIIGD